MIYIYALLECLSYSMITYFVQRKSNHQVGVQQTAGTAVMANSRRYPLVCCVQCCHAILSGRQTTPFVPGYYTATIHSVSVYFQSYCCMYSYRVLPYSVVLSRRDL